MEVERYKICFIKKLSKTDATGNLEIPGNAQYLPPTVAEGEDNEIMKVRGHGRIWEFKAPARKNDSRRYMTVDWHQFAKENELKEGDIVTFYRSTTEDNLYVLTFERTLKVLPLFPGASTTDENSYVVTFDRAPRVLPLFPGAPL